MPTRLRIGLTGGIASGKSTAADRFAALGVPVVDADLVSRAVVAPGEPGLAAVIAQFGRGVIGADGGLDRRALRDRVFADASARRELEAILHPRIRAEMERLANAAQGPYLILAIPLLVESGSRDRVDRILVVDTEERLQLERLTARDRISADQARAMLAAQASRAARLARADDVLSNAADIPELERGVDRLHDAYLRLARGT
jgi:dephospho-CoA kinase